MKPQSRIVKFETLVAVVTWFVISGTMISQILSSPTRYAGLLEIAAALSLGYFIAMMMASSPKRTLNQRRVASLVQLGFAGSMAWFIPIDYLQILTIIWIAMAVSLFGLRVAVVSLVLIGCGWFLLWEYHWFWDNAGFSVALYLTFHVFALMSSLAAVRAEEARDETQALYRELVATQHLLSEASRQ
ncbi:MAG: hypothetical protein AAAFM81_06870, partial [Pseudomonadota bacterium]